jgi:hypothetical protein
MLGGDGNKAGERIPRTPTFFFESGPVLQDRGEVLVMIKAAR